MPDEVEGKLIVLGPDAAGVCEDIVQLDEIAGLRVARREVELISDAYFDGPERQLFAVGLAMRVRTLNGRELVTIKGETRVQDGVISRDELEVEWSPEGFDDVLEALSQAGASLGGDIEAAREQAGASDALQALGLVAGSARENHRVALTLARNGDIVAEVAVDTVTFLAGRSAVRHYEVECESKGAGDAEVIRGVLDGLRSRYDGMRAWQVSKLELGEALSLLAEEGRLDALLDGDRLRPEAYRTIEGLMGGPQHDGASTA